MHATFVTVPFIASRVSVPSYPPEPGGAPRWAAHPVVVAHHRPAFLDIHLEPAVVVLPRIGVRRELQENREREPAVDEPPDGREVPHFFAGHPTNGIVRAVSEPGLDLVEHVERRTQGIPFFRIE